VAKGSRTLQLILIVALLVAVTVARLLVNEPGVGIAFLLVVPVVLGAALGGYAGAIVVATVSLGLFVLDEVIMPSEELRDGRIFPAAVTRGLVFFVVGLLTAYLLDQRTRLRESLERRDLELSELRALREALTPPAAPARPRLRIATTYVPAEGLAAGDFFLIAAGRGDTTLVAVGDVVGHGLGAARRALFVRACLASFATATDDPARLLELTNSALVERDGPSEEFVTVVCASVDPVRRLVTYAVAGHPAPLCLDTGSLLTGPRGAPPLGIQERISCTSVEHDLEPRSGLLLYSDGLTEARPPDSVAAAQFGYERISAELRALPGADPEEIVKGLRSAVAGHAGATLGDDLCLLAVRLTG